MSRHTIDESREETKVLSDWLHSQAAFYKRHAPSCVADITNFSNAAALLDSYQAGLALATPHPLTASEVVQWVDIHDAFPDDDRTVLIFSADDPLREPWPGYRQAGAWFAADGMPLGQNVTHWADMPTGPKPVEILPTAAVELAA